MKTVHVNLGARSYDILIAENLLQQVPGLFRKYNVPPRVFLVANSEVFRLYGQTLLDLFRHLDFDPVKIRIPDGEKHKNLQTVENIYTYLIAQGADRFSSLTALGGGVTGDLVGFVAATYLRGISYVQIPTTLLAQVDSSVGGKTGVNHHLGKNLIGAFYQPNLVCIDTATLNTLPAREFQSGLYETLKYGLIYDEEFFEYFEGHRERIQKRDPAVLETVISRCCEIKAEVISQDETEQDLRRILNFGHTFGHALEAATDFQVLTHGEAVAYGMLLALRVSVHDGSLDEGSRQRIARCLLGIGPLPSVETVEVDRILEAMRHDKKRQGDEIFFVLLKGLGRTSVRTGPDEVTLARTWEQVKAEVRSS